MGNEQYCCEPKEKPGEFNEVPLEDASEKAQEEQQNQYESSLERHLKKAKQFGRENKYIALSSANTSRQEHKKSSLDNVEKQSSCSNSKSNVKVKPPTSREKANKNTFYFPYLNTEVKKTLDKHQFESDNTEIEDLTHHPMPQGFGKFICKDQSVYIGSFRAGKAHGKGVLIFPDGSYYEGFFFNNKAEAEDGLYHSHDLTYKGAFKDNLFEGRGEEEGPNHTFKGLYTKGHKFYGILKWTQDDFTYTYDGTFNDQNQFDKRGTLVEPTGVYKGEFKNGFKHGHGIYAYNNGITYEGSYVNNRKEGRGELMTRKGKIIYMGEFKDGLPHGDGKCKDSLGVFHPKRMVMGIEADPEQKE